MPFPASPAAAPFFPSLAGTSKAGSHAYRASPLGGDASLIYNDTALFLKAEKRWHPKDFSALKRLFRAVRVNILY